MGSIQKDRLPGLSDLDLIKKLESSLKNSKILTPSSDGYGERIKRWSDASEKQAGAVVLATSAADISASVLFARTWSLDIAVCGGGHSTGGGSSSAGGLVIDLSQMRSVTVDKASKTITAQGGCLWEDVDNVAYEHGLATVGGTINHTGVGGLTLGGGYGWLSGEHGLVIDNLLAVQMVLADGSIVTASQSENTDLFWAVRGAGQSFGVAVEFSYRAYVQESSVWAGQMAFPPNNLEAVAAAANQIHLSTKGNSGLILGFARPPPMFAPIVLAVVYFNGPASEGEKYFAPLLALSPLMNNCASMPYPKLNSMINHVVPHGGRKVSKGATFATPLRAAFFRSIFDEYISFMSQNPDIFNVVLFEFLPEDKVCAVPRAATSFANRGQHQNALICPKWTDATQDEKARTWAMEMASKFTEEMGRGKRDGDVKMETEGTGQYGNYDGMNEKGQIIFGQNYARVLEFKKRYDPENIFNKSHVQIS